MPFLTAQQLATLEHDGMLTLPGDDLRPGDARPLPSIRDLALSLMRLQASAMRHWPECPECYRPADPEAGPPLCADCAARHHELEAA